MAYYINENDYPQNYDWIPMDKQKDIVDFLNYDTQSKSSLYDDMKYGAIKLLDAIGVKMEFDWVGHSGTWFLATYNDALAQQDFYDDMARDAEGDIDEYITGDCYDNNYDY